MSQFVIFVREIGLLHKLEALFKFCKMERTFTSLGRKRLVLCTASLYHSMIHDICIRYLQNDLQNRYLKMIWMLKVPISVLCSLSPCIGNDLNQFISSEIKVKAD